ESEDKRPCRDLSLDHLRRQRSAAAVVHLPRYGQAIFDRVAIDLRHVEKDRSATRLGSRRIADRRRGPRVAFRNGRADTGREKGERRGAQRRSRAAMHAASLFLKTILFFQSLTTEARTVKTYRQKVASCSRTPKPSNRTFTHAERYDDNVAHCSSSTGCLCFDISCACVCGCTGA